MAAGLGFKTFTTGEVLTAGDVNGYLMQGVLVFATAAARNSAITSPQEGQFAFTKDTNGLWYYDGAAWVASGATGDIEGVTAGVGISGGGTSGTVTVTNDMATTITTAGDLIKGTGSGTYNRLGIGSTGQVLTVASGAPSWATPSSGAVTMISQQTVTGSPVTTISFTSISGTYKNLRLVYNAAITSGSWDGLYMRLNADTGANYISQTSSAIQTSLVGAETVAGTYMILCRVGQAGASSGQIIIPNYAGTVLKKSVFSQGISIPAYTAGGAQLFSAGSGWTNTAAITQLDITVATGTIQWAVGTSFTLYGES